MLLGREPQKINKTIHSLALRGFTPMGEEHEEYSEIDLSFRWKNGAIQTLPEDGKSAAAAGAFPYDRMFGHTP